MFRNLYYCVFVSVFFSACSTPPLPEPIPESPQVNLDEVTTRLSALEHELVTHFTEICRDKEADLRKQLSSSKRKTGSLRKQLKATKKQCQQPKARAASTKLQLGGIENIELLLDSSVEMEARIDTGAETSSLGVYKLTKFERDGKDWVKFSLSPDKDALVNEYPVHDYVKIKQRDEAGSEGRFEIKLDIKMGTKTYRDQLFNLADRAHFEYQVLVGRSFLRDIAIVDVSTKHQLKRK